MFEEGQKSPFPTSKKYHNEKNNYQEMILASSFSIALYEVCSLITSYVVVLEILQEKKSRTASWYLLLLIISQDSYID